MDNNNTSIDKLNKRIDHYLEQEEYDRANEACLELCRAQGLTPADHMPENFLSQLKRKEYETMHIKKTSKRISGVIAAAAVAVLLIGGTVSAAVIHNNNIHFSTKGFFVPEGEEPQITFIPADGEETAIDPPEMSGENVITPLSEENGSASAPWLNKKVWDDTGEIWESDDGVNWEKGYQTTRVTEYRYADYFTAADDAGFDRIFKTNYTGDVFYYENEHLPDETDEKAGIDSTTDYSITGEISCGNGHFSIDQSKNYVNQSGEVSKAASMVITTTDETTNEREYLNASGISFQLSDDTESGNVRTTTMFTGEKYDTILQFTGMTEAEIHEVLDNIQP